MWFALLLLLVLSGCSSRDLYQEARTELRKEHYQAALAHADAAIEHTPNGSPASYRWRLLRVEILLEQREYKQAQQALNFELPPGAQWTGEWARYRLGQAVLDQWQKRLNEALSHLDQAQALAVTIGADGTLGEIELRRARVFIQQGNFAEADAILRRLVDDAMRRNDPYLQMRAKGNLGFSLMHASRFEEAIPFFQDALSMARTLGALDDEPRSLLNLGWCYYHLGELDKAQQDFEDCASKFQRTGNRLDGHTCLGNIATTLYRRHEYRAAAPIYLRALELATKLEDRQSRAYWLHNLARIAIDTGDWNAAERYNNGAWEIWKGDPQAEAYSIANAGYIAALRRDFGKAEESFRTAIASGDPVAVLDAHAGLAHAYASQGKDREAAAEYRATDAVVESRRRELQRDANRLIYFSGLIEFYQQYVDFMMTRSRPQEALEIAESSRARALADKLRLKHVRRGSAAGFQRMAAACGSVLLSYWIGPDRSYLWVITGSALKTFRLPPASRIRTMVEAYDALIQKARDPLNTENPAGRQLYDTLIAPASALLPKHAKVILVPDGPLHALNFETLPAPGGKPHYWIEEVTLSVTPSLDLLSLDRGARRAAPPSLLLIGNPVSPVADYPALQFAAQEMEGIRKSLSGSHQVVWEGSQAGPDAYARSAPGGFTFIHFVAHAVANPEEPLDSAIILSRQGTGYKLRAEDVLGTPLNAELVTISACRSAGARIYGGEGLVGLAWAFLDAGARNVIAGLWDVNDRSTAELAGHLYTELARGADPAGALRAAKLELIHAGGAFQKPYYWGPFEVFTRQAGAL